LRLRTMVSAAAGAIADRYRLLKGLRGGRWRITAYITILTAIFTVFTYFTTSDILLSAAVAAAGFMTTMGLNMAAEALLVSKTPNYTARRLNSLSVVELFILAVGLPVSALANLIHPKLGEAAYSLFIATASFIGYSVRRALGINLSPLTPTALTLTPMLLGTFTTYVYVRDFTKALLLSASAYLLGVVLMEASREVIDFKRVGGVKPFKLLQAFLTSLLSGLTHDLEELMSRLGRNDEVRCELFVVRREGRTPLALVVSDVHPGPFRTVGSSMLPSLIQQKLGEKGFEAAVLKGLSSHEKNIASRKTTEQLAERLAAEAHALLESNVFEDSFMTPMRKKLNGASALTVGIAGKRIIILTLHPHPMEDLSPEALPDTIPDDILVVDAHNSFYDGFKALENSSLEKLKQLIERLKDVRGQECKTALVGFSRFVPADIGLSEGMGAGGVSCVVFEVAGARYAVVAVDANNAMPWVRDMVLEIGRKYGCVEVELCTTDTHMVNAVQLGGRGYHPLGEVVGRGELERMFEEVFKQAVSSLAPAAAAHKTVVVKDVRVFADLLETIAGIVPYGIKTYAAAGLAASVSSLVLALII
jgi:putative membrane protein